MSASQPASGKCQIGSLSYGNGKKKDVIQKVPGHLQRCVVTGNDEQPLMTEVIDGEAFSAGDVSAPS